MKTFKTMINELNEDKIDKIIDDVFNSEDGAEFGTAWNDGDERAAEDILKQRGVKGPMLNKVMKRLFESTINEAYGKFQDDSYNTWSSSKAISYGKSKGYKVVAVVGDNKNTYDMILFALDSADKKYTKDVKLKAGQKIYRYATDATVAGKMMPLVIVNLDKGLMYHLSQESSSGEIDEPVFEKRAMKLAFSRVVKGMNEEKENDDKYKKFFDSALKKFGVKSPADFTSKEEKKKFYDYVDANYDAENETD